MFSYPPKTFPTLNTSYFGVIHATSCLNERIAATKLHNHGALSFQLPTLSMMTALAGRAPETPKSKKWFQTAKPSK
ncbi:MAG: hypothetical protein NTX75_02145 [Proteobacteria bacterium]|nr:hypothetical protein [Pseudomonadota bacterium]